jgi:hypothetical protein
VTGCQALGDTVPDLDGPGGVWTAACTCGWTKGPVRYSKDEWEPMALMLAMASATWHDGSNRAEAAS